jgi:hypothetical protein
MREKMCGGEAPFRKAYLGAILDRVEVDNGVICVTGQKDILEQAVARQGVITPGIRGFVRRKMAEGRDQHFLVILLIKQNNNFDCLFYTPKNTPKRRRMSANVHERSRTKSDADVKTLT